MMIRELTSRIWKSYGRLYKDSEICGQNRLDRLAILG
jgi:hypothetical protein